VRNILLLIILAVGTLQSAMAADQQPLVTYIGTNDYGIVNASVAKDYGVKLVVYNLDAHRDLEKRLSADLPADLMEAERIANERLKALDGRTIQKAFRGVALAIQWDLHKAPAFVFGNGEQVIYGVTNLEEALKRWNFYRMRH
jgi:integrating conjugative element protein (TIGR03757 family)